jgi:hypothetical protein
MQKVYNRHGKSLAAVECRSTEYKVKNHETGRIGIGDSVKS